MGLTHSRRRSKCLVKLAKGIYGIEVDFEPQSEPWVRYKLLDGGEIRLKTTVRKIYQMVDEAGTPNLDPQGLPNYGAEHKSDLIFKR